MNTRISVTALIVFGITLPPLVLAESLNVKTGSWEMTTTVIASGLQMPASAMDGLSPEQVSQMEQMMELYAKPITSIEKVCVTKEDLDQDRMLESDDQENCQQEIVSRSATRVVIKLTCSDPDPSTSTMTMEANDPESIVGSVDLVQGNGDGTVHLDINGRWLDASCEGVEEGG
jgi:hypothetical protein